VNYFFFFRKRKKVAIDAENLHSQEQVKLILKGEHLGTALAIQ